jgi:ABC-type sulfate/molybdate transport systems ATPase subunit
MVTHDVDEALFLSDRVVCMTDGPAATIGEILPVTFPRPRERAEVMAHPDYPNQVFEEMNRCIERKGWKQVRSPQEQKQLSEAIATEATRTAPPMSISDSKATESFAQRVQDRFTHASSSAQSGVKKD